MGLYDVDFHDWIFAQADAIRRRSANELDWENLAEEVESLGRSERRSLKSRLTKLIAHLIKWQLQPERRGRSWKDTVREQRIMIPLILEDSPSMRPLMEDVYDEAFARGRQQAAKEMNLEDDALDDFPAFALDQALDPRWPPGLATWEPEDDGR